MGWLRELMGSAKPPVASFGELARLALGHEHWPEGLQPKSRSLAALLSKLDRDIELSWLADRPEVQQALAGVLGCPIGEIELQFLRSEPALVKNVRLDDVRYARALRLGEEPLCPGIPPVVLEPARWSRLWWRAASGSGRSLAGLWLSARGLARFVRAETWQAAVTELPREGAVFVELGEAVVPGEPFIIGDRPRLRLCVAAPCPPPAGGWQAIESAPLEQYVDELVDWVVLRLPDDGRFDAAAAKAWIHRVALP